MKYPVSTIRRAVVLVALFMGVALLPLMFIPGPVAAAGSLTVLGYVYDSESQPVAGASVLVEVLAGSYPSNSGTTNGDGFYQLDIGDSLWEVGDTVRTTATYESHQEYAEAPAEADYVMQIDVVFTYAIPEFGSFAGVVVATVLMGSVAIMSMRRQRTK